MVNFTNRKSLKAVVARIIKFSLLVASGAPCQLLSLWNIQDNCKVNTQCDSHCFSVKQLGTIALHARWCTTTFCNSYLDVASHQFTWLEWPLQSPSHIPFDFY